MINNKFNLLFKVLFLLVVTSKFVLMQKISRYSLPEIEGGGLAKGNFFYGYLLCKQQSKQLATPDTDAKMNELLEFIDEYSIVKMWTSGTDLAEEGKFYWLTTAKPMTYTYFHANQPDNFVNVEHCVEVVPIYHDIKWNDVRCDLQTATIVCEEVAELDFNTRIGIKE